jgi:predicted transcriptional regulator
MTLKQERLIEGLINKDNIGKPVYKIAQEAGYTESVSKSIIYQDIRKHKIMERVAKAFNPEQVKRDILKAEKDFEKDKDNSNRSRMLELRAKILGLTKEVNAGQQVMINVNDTLEALKQPKREIVDVTPCSATG